MIKIKIYYSRYFQTGKWGNAIEQTTSEVTVMLFFLNWMMDHYTLHLKYIFYVVNLLNM